jgi:hypothetical protein
MPDSVCPYVNRQRAVDEIALIDKNTGEVVYGIQSLFKIIASSFPVFRPLFLFAPFVWLMRKVYAFISYNRRVIIPATTENYSIQPSFKIQYRVAYLLFTWFLTGFILTRYAPLLTGMVPVGSAYREYLICGGQIIFQGIIISLYKYEKHWNYLGNMMTISFGGSLLLLPGLIINHWFINQPLFYTIYFMAVAGLMFLEHIRRSKLLGLGWLLSLSWAAYRVLILLVIFILR